MSGLDRLSGGDAPGADELDALVVGARLHAGMGRTSASLALCNLAIRLAPADARFPRLAAAVLIDAGRGEEALGHLRRVEALAGSIAGNEGDNTADGALHLVFAFALQSAGRRDEARERFARYLASSREGSRS